MFNLIWLTVRRAREIRLGQVAGSLTFETVLSVVPVLAATFALFTRFPMFKRFEKAIEDYLLKSLLPPDIARTVVKYLGQFADNASGLTVVGLLFFMVTAVTMLLTIEDAFNEIWGVKKPRPFFRRIGLYLILLVIGPPVLGVSLWATSYLLSASMGLIGTLPMSLKLLLDTVPVLLSILGFAALFYLVPNTRVAKLDAIVGGVMAGLAFELGKRGFAAYVVKFPTYKAVYGTFAAFPVFLLWLYYSWLVTLTVALVTANLPRARAQAAQRAERTRADRRFVQRR